MESTIDFTDDDTYQKITGDWEGSVLNNFEFLPRGALKYVGQSGRHVLVNGSSDLSSSKAATTWYALFCNGQLVPGAETPHDFQTNFKIEGIGITALAELNYGDELEVYAKINDSTADIVVNTLRVTFWGEVR